MSQDMRRHRLAITQRASALVMERPSDECGDEGAHMRRRG